MRLQIYNRNLKSICRLLFTNIAKGHNPTWRLERDYTCSTLYCDTHGSKIPGEGKGGANAIHVRAHSSEDYRDVDDKWIFSHNIQRDPKWPPSINNDLFNTEQVIVIVFIYTYL